MMFTAPPPLSSNNNAHILEKKTGEYKKKCVEKKIIFTKKMNALKYNRNKDINRRKNVKI